MSESNEGGAGGAGARTLTIDSPEVQKIGALLRGEKPAPDDEGKGAGAAAGSEVAGAAAASGDDEGDAEGAAAGVGDQEGDGAAVEDGAGDHDGEPVTLADLAKTLGVKEGELYDEVKVEVETTLADGTKGREAVSLGELRRGYVGARKLERERETFEADSDKRSLEFMQTRAQLEYLGELIFPNAPREVVDKVTRAFGERDARERTLLLEAVPEWKDPAKFTADRAGMVEFLKPWGFKPADIYAIADHRIARFVRDMAREHKRKAEAERKARERGNGEVKRGQQPDGRASVAPLRARLANIVKAGKAATTAEGKTQAIGALLRSTVKR